MSSQNSDAGSGDSNPSTVATRTRTYMCYRGDQCGMVFNNLIDLDLHMQQRGHWQCGKCGDNYADKDAFHQHGLRLHPEPMDLKCPGCHVKFERAGNLMQHIERGYCRILKPRLLHLRRKQRMAFQLSLRRLNPGNELACLDPIPNDGARPHMKPDNNFINVVNDLNDVDDVVDYSKLAGPMTAKYRSGNSKVPDLLTGENHEALNQVPRGENDTFSPWNEPEAKAPEVKAPQTKVWERDPDPQTLPVEHGRRLVDPDHPDFTVAPFYNAVYREYICPYQTCGKKYKAAHALTGHLQSLAHKPKVEITCPRCCQRFNTMTAAMNHAEAPLNRKCDIQYDENFRQFVYQASGCILDIAGEMLNGQPRFVNVGEDDRIFEVEENEAGCESLASQMSRARLSAGQSVVARTQNH